MQTLLILLVCIFAGLAVLVLVTEKFSSTGHEERTAKLQRWITPLVGLMLVLSALEYFLRGA